MIYVISFNWFKLWSDIFHILKSAMIFLVTYARTTLANWVNLLWKSWLALHPLYSRHNRPFEEVIPWIVFAPPTLVNNMHPQRQHTVRTEKVIAAVCSVVLRRARMSQFASVHSNWSSAHSFYSAIFWFTNWHDPVCVRVKTTWTLSAPYVRWMNRKQYSVWSAFTTQNFVQRCNSFLMEWLR